LVRPCLLPVRRSHSGGRLHLHYRCREPSALQPPRSDCPIRRRHLIPRPSKAEPEAGQESREEMLPTFEL
jgi:hypothetical protein